MFTHIVTFFLTDLMHKINVACKFYLCAFSSSQFVGGKTRRIV